MFNQKLFSILQVFAQALFSFSFLSTLIRSANNGISTIINPSGKIKSLIDLEETGSIYTNEIKHKVTLFSKYGNKMYFVLIFIYIFLILSIRRLDHE